MTHGQLIAPNDNLEGKYIFFPAETDQNIGVVVREAICKQFRLVISYRQELY